MQADLQLIPIFGSSGMRPHATILIHPYSGQSETNPRMPRDSYRSYKARLTGRSVSGPGGTWCHGRSSGQWAPVLAGSGQLTKLVTENWESKRYSQDSVGTVPDAHSGRLADAW